MLEHMTLERTDITTFSEHGTIFVLLRSAAATITNYAYNKGKPVFGE